MEDLKTANRTTMHELKDAFKDLHSNQQSLRNRSVQERISALKRLHQVVLASRDKIKVALHADFRKHPSEVDLTEVYPVTHSIKHTIRNLKRWMKDETVDTPLTLLGSRSFVRYEPKGVVLIISPWNFPVTLTFGPLISAVAAGNAVMLKPSEYTPNTSAVMKEIVEKVFSGNEVLLVEGGIEVSQNILKLPFNHIFFTGSPSVGKIVMKAAAEHLASVTLELGGKSPTIVDETADLDVAARRITWGKYLNNGQICIAPDHVFVHKSVQSTFLSKVKSQIHAFYSEDASNEASYARIVSERHFSRIKAMLVNSVEDGTKVAIGGGFKDDERYLEPTVLYDVNMKSEIHEEEIFGPILPIYPFTDLKEVITKINSREKPLAVYIYSKNRKKVNYILDNTRAGGGCINHNTLHYFNPNLPFGGSNNSGIGKAHGKEGFKAFSNARGILKQYVPNALELLMPPYSDFKQRLINIAIKWF